jgi:glycogen synthase
LSWQEVAIFWSKMIKRVAELGMSTKFHFTGFLKGDDVDKMFGMSDVYVMPSVSEPFGISPARSYAIKCTLSLYPSNPAWLKYSNMPSRLIFGISMPWQMPYHGLISYSSLPQMFKNYGKEEVDNIKWDQAGEKVKEIYDQVVSSFMHQITQQIYMIKYKKLTMKSVCLYFQIHQPLQVENISFLRYWQKP